MYQDTKSAPSSFTHLSNYRNIKLRLIHMTYRLSRWSYFWTTPVLHSNIKSVYYCNKFYSFLLITDCITFMEIKQRLSLGNVCYYSLQNILSSNFTSFLLPKTTKIKENTHITVMIPITLFMCETWSLRVRDEGKWRCFKTRHWREYLDLRDKNQQRANENCKHTTT